VNGRGGQGRQRLFIAFRLPPVVVATLARWQRRELHGVDGVRVLPPEHLHVTALFLGSRPEGEVGAIGGVLNDCTRAARRPAFHLHQYRETSRVGMLVLKEDRVSGDADVHRGSALTGCLMRSLESLGLYRPEPRGWTPHITVSRFRRPPRLAPPLPELGSFSPSDVVLYESMLQPGGSVYRELAVAPIPV